MLSSPCNTHTSRQLQCCHSISDSLNLVVELTDMMAKSNKVLSLVELTGLAAQDLLHINTSSFSCAPREEVGILEEMFNRVHTGPESLPFAAGMQVLMPSCFPN